MNKPIHILQVVLSLAIGGTERVVCDLVRRFNDGEFRTSVCSLDGIGAFGEDLRRDGIAVHLPVASRGWICPWGRACAISCGGKKST